ncbi:MAG TPA: hypothetical protein VLJ17_02455, partial [Xanthobacteraceae bacterium]|nr:hypothetical protein [Xanthobacteraceae bacterium]
GRPRYKIPPHTDIINVVVNGNQRHNQMVAYALVQVAFGYDGKPKGQLGMPRQFAIIGSKIEFWPIPDKAYQVKVRYTPPIQEF